MDELINIRRHFQDFGNFDSTMDFLHAHGNPREALLYRRLFCPETIEYRGMVFLKYMADGEDEKRKIDQAYEKNGFDAEATEKQFNWEEIPYFFADRGFTDDEDYDVLAEALSFSWLA